MQKKRNQIHLETEKNDDDDHHVIIGYCRLVIIIISYKMIDLLGK